MLVTQWVLSTYLLKDRRKEAAWWERTAAREDSGRGHGDRDEENLVRWMSGLETGPDPGVELSGLAPGPAASLIGCVTLGELLPFSVLLSPYF